MSYAVQLNSLKDNTWLAQLIEQLLDLYDKYIMRPTTLCSICNRAISNNNIERHKILCANPVKKKIRGIDFDPNSGYSNGTRVAWNKGLTSKTDKRIENYGNSISKTLENRPLHGCFAWTEEQYRQHAKNVNLGGYRENAGRSKKYRIKDSYGKEIVLQSSYELKCSDILNELSIKWCRPGALKYNGRNYFADFYLPDYDIYLDPKNNYKAKIDKVKIDTVIQQNNVRVFVLSKEQLIIEFISNLIKDNGSIV